MEYAFPDACRSWQGVPIQTLFDVEVSKRVSEVRRVARVGVEGWG